MTGAPDVKANKRKKGIYIGAPACFALEMAVRQVCEAFGGYRPPYYSGCYIVGSVLERQDWRDVDIRFIMQDELFAETFPDAEDNWEFDPKWLLLTTAISEWLSKRTGLPVDFQFQPQTHANERHKGPRSAIGLKFAQKKKEKLQDDSLPHCEDCIWTQGEWCCTMNCSPGPGLRMIMP